MTSDDAVISVSRSLSIFFTIDSSAPEIFER